MRTVLQRVITRNGTGAFVYYWRFSSLVCFLEHQKLIYSVKPNLKSTCTGKVSATLLVDPKCTRIYCGGF